MATESLQSSNCELDLTSDNEIPDNKKMQQISSPALAQKLSVLPTLFSNNQLSDHQLQQVNVDNIMNQRDVVDHNPNTNIDDESLEADNKEKIVKVFQKRSFLRKLLSFSSFEGKDPCSTQKESVKKVKKDLKKVKSLVTSTVKESPSHRNKLKNQSKSLNAAFNSITSSNSLVLNIDPKNINDSLVFNESNIKDTKSDTFIDKNFNITTTTITDINVYESSPTALHTSVYEPQKLTNSPLSFFNVGFTFNRISMTGSQKTRNYKEKIKSLNVRRKSSMMNDRCLVDCSRTPSQILKSMRISKNIENEWKSTNLDCNFKADYFHLNNTPEDYLSSTYENAGILMSVSDIDFRDRLVKLQKKHREFNHASSQYLTTGSIKITKRKKAFDAVDLNLNCPLNLSFTELYPNHQYLSNMVSLVSQKLIILGIFMTP